MKKLLFAIITGYLIAFFIAGPLYAASYYGCANAAINADSTFSSDPTSTPGDCKAGAQTAATVLAGTHSLFANGCTITIPKGVTITAAKISNKDDGSAMVDGGQFTVTTTGWDAASVLQAAIETGGTTGAALAISGNGNLNPVFTIGSSGTPVTITAGSASAMNGVTDSHAAGTVVVYATLSAPGFASAHGYAFSGTSGSVTGYGTATGSVGIGLNLTNVGTATWNGDCVGSDVGNVAGCQAASSGAITLVGNSVNGARGVGVQGTIRSGLVAPAAGVTGNYVKFNGGGTPAYFGPNTDDATKALSTFYYIDPTDGGSEQGSATSGGGGGAWGF